MGIFFLKNNKRPLANKDDHSVFFPKKKIADHGLVFRIGEYANNFIENRDREHFFFEFNLRRYVPRHQLLPLFMILQEGVGEAKNNL